MDLEEFLSPIPRDLQESFEHNNPFLIGNKIKFALDNSFDEHSIVLFSIPEYYGFTLNEDIDPFFSKTRKFFYNLSCSNWKRNLYDLGTILPGKTFEDTCFALHSIISQFSERKISVICLGGTQALSYIIYQGIRKKYINVATIDVKLDINASTQQISHKNFITKMILDKNQKLLEYVNLASQAPYNAIEEFDILEQLNFENLRLGKITENISLAEPLLREMDLVSIDLSAMQKSSFKSALIPHPNGLNEREICGIMRYCGLSTSIKNIHIANSLINNNSDANLVAEMLWYFVDAQNNQKDDSTLETYRIQFDEQEIVFFKSKNSERWWIQVMVDDNLKNIPCSAEDYKNTMKGELPDKWLRFFKKFY